MNAFDFARDMGAGWNLGNTLDTGGADPAPITAAAQETLAGNPVTTAEMIGLLAKSGFSTLRIPITWQRHIGSAPDYLIEEAFLNRVREIVDYGMDRNLYVVINLHHEHWHFPSLENEEKAKGILTALWRQLAVFFAGYSDRLVFEAMNEPRMKGTPQEWTGGTEEARAVLYRWNEAFIKTVRATEQNNKKRFLLIPTIAASGDAAAIADFPTPADKNTLVSIHAYKPHDFALNTKDPAAAFDPENPADTADVDALFERLRERFIARSIPVVIGETGCLNKGENTAARAAWTDYYTKKAAALGIPCFWWDNGARTNADEEEAFGIMNRRENSWWYPEIARAMIRHYGK